MVMSLHNVQISGCGTGIKTNATFRARNLSINSCGTAMKLSGAAKSSQMRDVKISDCLNGIVLNSNVSASSDVQKSFSELLPTLKGETEKGAVEKIRRSGFGRWLEAQKFTDWGNLAANIFRTLGG